MPFKKPHQTADINFIHDKAGKKGFDIESKGLNIIWGNDTRYWTTTTENYAELIQVSWLEVSGKVRIVAGGEYKVKFHVGVNRNGFGWEGTPVLVMAKVGKKGKYKYAEAKLECIENTLIIPDDTNEVIVKANDGDPNDLELHFGLYEVWSGKWKGGLIIKKAEIIKIN